MHSLLTYLLVTLLSATYSLAYANDDIQFENNRLSAHLEDADINTTLDRIEILTGIKILADENMIGERISIELNEVNLEKALNRVLRRYNKSYEYDKLGEIKTIFVSKQTQTNSIRKTRQSAHSSSNLNTKRDRYALPNYQLKQYETPPPPSYTMEGESISSNDIEPPDPIIEEEPPPMPIVEEDLDDNSRPGTVLPSPEYMDTIPGS